MVEARFSVNEKRVTFYGILDTSNRLLWAETIIAACSRKWPMGRVDG